MQLLRLILVSLVCGAFAIFIGRVLVTGLRTGRIAHSDTSSFCEKKNNPLGYWSLVILLSVFFSGSIYIWAKVVYDIYKN